MLINELKDKQDSFITVTVGDKEYAISHTKMVKTNANIDDKSMHRTIVCSEITGNIVK